MKAIVDCNSFYCSCERMFRPDLKKKPVVVLSNNDGCIISRTDEAKALGVGMAAPYYQNRELIETNGVSVFSSNYNLYGDLSLRVMDVLKELVGPENVEVYSVDEAFLNLDLFPPGELNALASRIKETVEQWVGIEVSVGVGPTKVLAKLANRVSKKNKKELNSILILDTDDKISETLQKTPVDELWGVGYRYAKKLKDTWNIFDALQLRQMPEEWARAQLGGVVGVRFIKELKGEPAIGMKKPLETKKMIATTRMFGKPVQKLAELKEAIATYTSRAAEKLRRQFYAASEVDVFVVTNDYEHRYRYNPQSRHCSVKLLQPTSHTNELIKTAVPLVESLFRPGSNYLKAGVILGGLVPDTWIQRNIFNRQPAGQLRGLMEAMDNINFSMRGDVVKYVASGLHRNWKMRQEKRSRQFTTRWDELYEVK